MDDGQYLCTPPESLRQGAFLAKAAVPASYASAQYSGVNAFELVNAKGHSQFVRWQLVPSAGVVGLNDEQLKAMPDPFLFDELRKRVPEAPVSFDFKRQLALEGDTLVDPTQVWPDSRIVVPAGTLVIDKVEADMGGACDKSPSTPWCCPRAPRRLLTRSWQRVRLLTACRWAVVWVKSRSELRRCAEWGVQQPAPQWSLSGRISSVCCLSRSVCWLQ